MGWARCVCVSIPPVSARVQDAAAATLERLAIEGLTFGQHRRDAPRLDDNVGPLHVVRGDDCAALDEDHGLSPLVKSPIRSIASWICASGASSETRTQPRHRSPKELPGNMSTPASSRSR